MERCATEDCGKPAAKRFEYGDVGSMYCIDCYVSICEAAWERQQEALMESGGPDDSAYRRDMIAAGRGHLLRD